MILAEGVMCQSPQAARMNSAATCGMIALPAARSHIAGRDVSCGDEVAEPLRGIFVDLVVVGGHAGGSV